MEGLKQDLDARVYVALGRGLWDCNARDVFNYVEALQEGRENRVRQGPGLSRCSLGLPGHAVTSRTRTCRPVTSACSSAERLATGVNCRVAGLMPWPSRMHGCRTS